MKLVELLARELKEWPKGSNGNDAITQDEGGRLNSLDEGMQPSFNDADQCWEGVSHSYLDFRLEEAEDFATAVVTRAQWQAERDRQKGGEWKRHRGGSRPVEDGAWVEVKLRCGDIQQGLANAFLWRHADCDHAANIMQYRVISQPQAEEVEVNTFVGKDVQVEYAFSQDGVALENLDWKPIGGKLTSVNGVDPALFGAVEDVQLRDQLSTCKESTVAGELHQIDGPIKWRDTIIHCQAIIEDCEREIERNVDLLDAEGLMMQTDSKKAMQHYAPDVDMSDWRNLKVGDVIECLPGGAWLDSWVGTQVTITEVEPKDYDGKLPICGDNGTLSDWGCGHKFIRRP